MQNNINTSFLYQRFILISYAPEFSLELGFGEDLTAQPSTSFAGNYPHPNHLLGSGEA
jgi:hypothetical protein